MRSAISVYALCLLAVACNDDPEIDRPPEPPPPGEDFSEVLFDPDTVIEVDIELAAEDWDVLRLQGRTEIDVLGGPGDCMAEPTPKPYDYFSATVTVEGIETSNVGVRKKGLIGSLSTTKPSLKIKFDEFAPDQLLRGVKRMTLNNAKSDPSLINQCLGYKLFGDAGVPSPRCNFARVTVNAEFLGVYVHVESIKKRFLRRHFDDDEGNLYEGSISDFRIDWKGTFERKTNKDDVDRSDIDEVVAAAGVEDSELQEAIGSVIDFDELLSFWSMEVLVGHSDGHAGNTNNFYFYDDPATGLIQFIPWGIDAIFHDGNGFGGSASRTGTFATAILSRRLFMYEPTRQLYEARVRQLLDTVWDEATIIAEIDRMEALLSPHVDDPGFADRVQGKRDFVNGRRSALLGVLEPSPPPWTAGLRDPMCVDVVGNISLSFETEFDTLAGSDPFATGTGSYAAEVLSQSLDVTDVTSLSGLANEHATIGVMGHLSDGTYSVVLVTIQPSRFSSGAVLPFDWSGAVGELYTLVGPTGELERVGLLDDGTISLDSVSTEPGAPITGTLSADIYDEFFDR